MLYDIDIMNVLLSKFGLSSIDQPGEAACAHKAHAAPAMAANILYR